MTVQSDLCLPSLYATAGDFGSPKPEILAPAKPVSLLAAASHRLRKAQLGAASGQYVPGQIPLPRMNCSAKGRTCRYNL